MGYPKPDKRITLYVTGAILALGVLLLAACASPQPQPTLSAPSATISLTPIPTPSATPLPLIRTPRSVYPTPRLTPVITIPPALEGVELPAEARVLALIGSDSTSPFSGRTDAVLLAIYHPRLGRVSLLSVPPDLFGYIPGYTMQRLNTAYAVGGFRMLADSLEYNLGVRPDNYALIHLDDFVYFIDDLGGLEVTVSEPLPEICGDIPQGTSVLNGDQVVCYVRYRNGPDELGRDLREQEILRLLIQRMAGGGSLVRLPEFYMNYHKSVESSLSLVDLLTSIPYFLRLGDADHLGYFQLSGDAMVPFVYPDRVNPQVYLPRADVVRVQVQDAINYILTPVISSDRVITLEYELTISPTPTITNTPTDTPTITPTLPPTSSPTATPTRTPTPTGSITITISPTATLTPTP